MASKVITENGAVVASWAIGNSDPVSMGPLEGNSATVQFAVVGERLQGSNDGTNWDTLLTGAGAVFDIQTLTGVPRYLRARAATDVVPTGTVIVVGWIA